METCVRAAADGASGSHASVWCWGSNWSGALGAGLDVDATSLPVQVIDAQSGQPVGEAISLDVKDCHACMLDPAGRVLCWGLNNGGELGRVPRQSGQDLDFSAAAVTITDGDGTPFSAPGGSVSAGQDHACVVWPFSNYSDMQIWCWGNDDSGQLGDGHVLGEPSYSPVPVAENALRLGSGTR